MHEYRVIVNLKVKLQGLEQIIPVGTVITLSEPQAARLLEAGKVVPAWEDVIPLAEYENLFRQALEGLAVQDPEGEAVRLIREDAGPWSAIQAAEDEVNRLWKQAQSCQSVWTDYSQAVENWNSLFQQAIESEKLISRLSQVGKSEARIDIARDNLWTSKKKKNSRR